MLSWASPLQSSPPTRTGPGFLSQRLRASRDRPPSAFRTGRDRPPLTPFHARADMPTERVDLRVSCNGWIGFSLAGMPALLGFPTSGFSRRLGVAATLDYRFSSGETPRHHAAVVLIRVVASASAGRNPRSTSGLSVPGGNRPARPLGLYRGFGGHEARTRSTRSRRALVVR